LTTKLRNEDISCTKEIVTILCVSKEFGRQQLTKHLEQPYALHGL